MRKPARKYLPLIVVAGIVLAVLYLFKVQREGSRPVSSPGSATVATPGEGSVIDLYFADVNGRRLALERREIAGGTVEERIRQSVDELIKGPGKRELTRTIPGEAVLRAWYFKDGVAYVDLASSVTSGHPGGAWTEILTVYSLVNTVAENMPEVQRVQILVEGKEAETLAGHVDISRPLPPRVQLLSGDWD